MSAWRLGLVASLAVVCPREAAADPRGTLVTWRVLENRGPDEAPFASVLEVVARSAGGAARTVATLRLPCYVSTDDGVLSCVYGGAFDYLRVRRAGRACVIEAQRSTEHGMRPRRVLGRFACGAPVEEVVEQGGQTRRLGATPR